MSDERFMRRALRLAERGLCCTSPNPMVGCVLVKGGRVVGEGWHRRFGGPHAEPDALYRARARAKGATAYVNLEPCCFYGKTPPCTEALINAGVRRVVAAMKDPNPRVAGKGLAALKRAGISVACGVLEEPARELNRAFSTWITRKRPHVVLKAAASLDGRIETSAGRSKWITSPETRALSRRMRAEWDGILVGVDTVLADDPRLTATRKKGCRHPGLDCCHPVRVILDSRLRTSRRARVLTGPGRALLISDRPPPAKRGAVRHLRVPRRKGGLDLGIALRKLAGEGLSSLLVEGGSAVHTAFLEAGLVDEVMLFLSPRLIGGEKARSFFEGSGFKTLERSLKLRAVAVRRVGPDILVTGRIPHPRR